jgi:hypothetical protein
MLAARNAALGGGGRVQLLGGTVTAFGITSPTATVRIANDGRVYHGQNLGFTNESAWLLAGAASQFEIRATLVSGYVPEVTGAWLALSSTREWSCTDVLADSTPETAIVTLEIRRTGTVSVLATANWTLTADRGL